MQSIYKRTSVKCFQIWSASSGETSNLFSHNWTKRNLRPKLLVEKIPESLKFSFLRIFIQSHNFR